MYRGVRDLFEDGRLQIGLFLFAHTHTVGRSLAGRCIISRGQRDGKGSTARGPRRALSVPSERHNITERVKTPRTSTENKQNNCALQTCAQVHRCVKRLMFKNNESFWCVLLYTAHTTFIYIHVLLHCHILGDVINGITRLTARTFSLLNFTNKK